VLNQLLDGFPSTIGFLGYPACEPAAATELLRAASSTINFPGTDAQFAASTVHRYSMQGCLLAFVLDSQTDQIDESATSPQPALSFVTVAHFYTCSMLISADVWPDDRIFLGSSESAFG
jgi:hypothetical protein